MPHRTGVEDDWGEDEDDFESDDDDVESEGEEDDEEPTIPCPYCHRQIHEDSQRCPYCENYISAEDAPANRKSLWFALGLLLCVSIVILWIIGSR